jgi:hypothetical protein
VTPTTRQSLLGTADDIAWRRTIPPEDRPPAMRVQVALAEALTREARLRALLTQALPLLTIDRSDVLLHERIAAALNPGGSNA